MDGPELIAQVKVLYPYLDFVERLAWVDRLEHLYPSRVECMTDLASVLRPNERNSP